MANEFFHAQKATLDLVDEVLDDIDRQLRYHDGTVGETTHAVMTLERAEFRRLREDCLEQHPPPGSDWS